MSPDKYDHIVIQHSAEPILGIQIQGPQVLRTHPESACSGEDRPCVIHRPSEHHMRSMPLNWRGDTGVMERLCSHGVGHPDPDAAAYAKSTGRTHYGVHGCDGCCVPPKSVQ